MKSIGIVGYSAQKFDRLEATTLISKALRELAPSSEVGECELVGGLTDMGINAIAYRIASMRGMKTVGIAPEAANEHEHFDVDEKVIVGENWGDESETFVIRIDYLIRVGGGDQSHAEVKAFLELDENNKDKVIEYDLESKED